MTTTPTSAASGSTYVLGHADAEVQRLLLQGLITMPPIITAWARVQK